MRICGPLLTLRYATPRDARRLYELGVDAEVTRFFSWGPYTELTQAQAYIAGLEAKRDTAQLLEFVIEHVEHGVVGVTGLAEYSARDRRAMVGTWLGRAFWGSGANAESKALICALAFGPMALGRLGAYANPGNSRSYIALERLGFRREGHLRAWHRHGDSAHDVLIYGLLREEWESSPMSDVTATIDGAPPAAYLV